MQLTIPLTDTPIHTVTPTESLRRSRRAKLDSHSKLNASKQRESVLACIQSAGEQGMTRNEIAESLGIPLSSVCPRVHELLKAERPLIYISATRRESRSVIIHRS